MSEKIIAVQEVIVDRIRDEGFETPKFIVDKSITKKVVAYASMKTDIEFAIKAIAELISLTRSNGEESIVKTALLKSIIITYMRCFTGSKSYSYLKAQEVFKLNPELIEVHFELERMRHLYLAHREESEYEQCVVYYSQFIVDGDIKQAINCKSLYMNNLGMDNLERIPPLLEFLRTYILSRHTKFATKLLNTLVENPGLLKRLT